MRPIAAVLTEFRPPLPVRPISTGRGGPAVDETAAAAVTARIEAARRDGGDAAALSVAATYEARLAALEADHARQRADDRAAWAAEEGAILARLLGDRIATLEDTLASAAAEVLAPLLPEAARRRTVDDLRAVLATLLEEAPDGVLTISGQRDVVGVLAQSCGDRRIVTCLPSDAPDVEIRLGDTRIRSALAPWGERLAVELGAAG